MWEWGDTVSPVLWSLLCSCSHMHYQQLAQPAAVWVKWTVKYRKGQISLVCKEYLANNELLAHLLSVEEQTVVMFFWISIKKNINIYIPVITVTKKKQLNFWVIMLWWLFMSSISRPSINPEMCVSASCGPFGSAFVWICVNKAWPCQIGLRHVLIIPLSSGSSTNVSLSLQRTLQSLSVFIFNL